VVTFADTEHAAHPQPIDNDESRIFPCQGRVLSDGIKYALIHYFKSDLQVD
jgi:hypothetical protein